MTRDSHDWLGIRTEVQHALAEPVLEHAARGEQTDPKATAQAAYRLAVALGKSRLFAVDLGEWNGTMPGPLAIAAARRLSELIRDWQQEALQLSQRWENTDDEVEAKECSLSLLDARMDAWAVFVALNESSLDCSVHDLPCSNEIAEAFDTLAEQVATLDAQLQAQEDLLSVAAGTELLDNWWNLLDEPYRLSPPWWLDGTLDAAAARLKKEAWNWARLADGLRQGADARFPGLQATVRFLAAEQRFRQRRGGILQPESVPEASGQQSVAESNTKGA